MDDTKRSRDLKNGPIRNRLKSNRDMKLICTKNFTCQDKVPGQGNGNQLSCPQDLMSSYKREIDFQHFHSKPGR